VTAAGPCLSNVWLLNPFLEKVKLKPGLCPPSSWFSDHSQGVEKQASGRLRE
jgi:hypothetical protein